MVSRYGLPGSRNSANGGDLSVCRLCATLQDTYASVGSGGGHPNGLAAETVESRKRWDRQPTFGQLSKGFIEISGIGRVMGVRVARLRFRQFDPPAGKAGKLEV